MDWTHILFSAGSAIVGAGLLASASAWLKAQAKKAENEADAVKTTADAEAKATLAEADMDSATAQMVRENSARLTTIEAAMRKCEEEREADRKECERRLLEQKGDTDQQIRGLRDSVTKLEAQLPAGRTT